MYTRKHFRAVFLFLTSSQVNVGLLPLAIDLTCILDASESSQSHKEGASLVCRQSNQK